MPLMGRDPAELLAAKERQQACVSEAVRTGVLSGIEGGAVSGACVFALNHYVEFFRTKFPVSAKTSFVARAKSSPLLPLLLPRACALPGPSPPLSLSLIHI